MILSDDEIKELTETDEDKLQKLANGKLLSATEKIAEGITALAKENNENAVKFNKAMSSLIKKVESLSEKPEKEIDLSSISEAINNLAESNKQKSKETEVISGLIKIFATELQNNRSELKKMLDKSQPKDYENNFNQINKALENKKPEEWKFDMVRDHGGNLVTIKAKAIGNG